MRLLLFLSVVILVVCLPLWFWQDEFKEADKRGREWNEWKRRHGGKT